MSNEAEHSQMEKLDSQDEIGGRYTEDMPPGVIAIDRLWHGDYIGVLGEENHGKFVDFIWSEIGKSTGLDKFAFRVNSGDEQQPYYLWLECEIMGIDFEAEAVAIEATVAYIPDDESEGPTTPEELEGVPIYEVVLLSDS